MKVALISGAPLKDCSEIGAAYYTRALAAGLRQRGFDVAIWSKLGCGEPAASEAPVIPTWRPGWFAWYDIAAAIRKRRPDVVHVQHSMFVLGAGASGEISMLLLLLLLRFMRVPLIVTVHDVPALGQVTQEYVHLHGYKFPAPAVTLGLRVLFWAIGSSARAIVVHQDAFARILVNDFHIAPRKIAVVPHVDVPVITAAKDARASLGLQAEDRIVLFFGFATRYKGIELLLDAVASLGSLRVKLLLGAGEHPKVAHMPEYRRYYDELKARARATPGVEFLGFLPDARLGEYVDAADAAIFPYVEFQGMSGPLNICAAHGRPFLVSTEIAGKIPGLHSCAFEPRAGAIANAIERFFTAAAYRAAVEDECRRFGATVAGNDAVARTAGIYARRFK